MNSPESVNLPQEENICNGDVKIKVKKIEFVFNKEINNFQQIMVLEDGQRIVIRDGLY